MESAVLRMVSLPIETELVFTPSICSLNHFLSSRRMNCWLLLIWVIVGEISFWNCRRSAASWSALVERMRLPCGLKLAATTRK